MSAPQLTWSDWSFEPTIIVGLLFASALYVVARRRRWLSGPDVQPWCFFAGVAVCFVALQSPIDTGGDEYLLSLHMLQHILLMMVVPPLVLLGVRTAAKERRSSRNVVWTTATWCANPWAAASIFTAVLLVWHVPAFYDTTLTVELLHVFEHITFVAVGLLFWWPIVEPWRSPSTSRVAPFAKIVVLVVSGIPQTILGLAMAMAPQPLYSFYADAPRLWGVSALTDQQIAGTLMFGLGNLIYFVPISFIFMKMLKDPAADERDGRPFSAAC